MNNNRRRPFRGRTKNNFRRRNGGSHTSQSNQFSPGSNGNLNFTRNGSMSNPLAVEKVIQKFQQLAKDAQSSGDPILVQNYLQHADHFSRRLAELNSKNHKPSLNDKNEETTQSIPKTNSDKI